MKKIYLILVSSLVLSACGVDIISDKEAIDRLHQKEGKAELDQALMIAQAFANKTVSPVFSDTMAPNYNDYPIFVTHANALREKGLPVDASKVFTTQRYEDALAITKEYLSGKTTNDQAVVAENVLEEPDSHTH
ncbi:TPA: hypothetical protein ACGIK9_002905 [Acinetobacter baumannii]|uniref:hypothetical protein n=1 Tax=Acinetobacter baumannii TaxID=470 RepID=UPI00338D3F0A